MRARSGKECGYERSERKRDENVGDAWWDVESTLACIELTVGEEVAFKREYKKQLKTGR